MRVLFLFSFLFISSCSWLDGVAEWGNENMPTLTPDKSAKNQVYGGRSAPINNRPNQKAAPPPLPPSGYGQPPAYGAPSPQYNDPYSAPPPPDPFGRPQTYGAPQPYGHYDRPQQPQYGYQQPPQYQQAQPAPMPYPAPTYPQQYQQPQQPHGYGGGYTPQQQYQQPYGHQPQQPQYGGYGVQPQNPVSQLPPISQAGTSSAPNQDNFPEEYAVPDRDYWDPSIPMPPPGF